MDMQYFSDVKGVSVVRDAHGMVNAVYDLLENETRRQRAARAAQESVLSAHLYEHRLKKIADITGANFKRHVTLTEIAATWQMRVLMCTHSLFSRRIGAGSRSINRPYVPLSDVRSNFSIGCDAVRLCRLTTANGGNLSNMMLRKSAGPMPCVMLRRNVLFPR